MLDFRVVQARSILPVHSVRPVRDFLPPSVLVIGNRMDLAQEVLFNGVSVQEFIVSGPERLLVRIPEGQVGRPLVELQVLSSVSLTQKDALVSFAVGRPTRKVEGLDRLVQVFLLVLMSTPGSDVFDKNSGGAVRSLIGKSVDGKSLAPDLALAIEKTRAEILLKQADVPGLPASEKLLHCELEALQSDPASATLSARVRLQNMLGESAEVSLR